jgi:S1-C subfamily serine protease
VTVAGVLIIARPDRPGVAAARGDELRVGDVVLAIGNALGIGQTVTQGIVSATGRNRIGVNTFENFIQTDAAINFGNSGGALVDVRGRLVGINSVRFDFEGIGFAIPAGIALEVARQILETGAVVRGWIGIEARDLTPTLGDLLDAPAGVVVLGVLAGGPADVAGIRAGDVLTAIAGEAIGDSRSAIDLIAAQKPGTRVRIAGIRQRAPYTVEVSVSRRPVPAT